MPSVCLYFQVHQPLRLKPYTRFRIGKDHAYFDEEANAAILRKVADKCYVPANRAIRRMIERHGGRFRVAYAVSGVALEQMRRHAPEALESFAALARTGCAEFLAETYYHSLASVHDEAEFRLQVAQHAAATEALFGRRPRVFRNTELIYSDAIGRSAAAMGYRGILAEGADDILGWRSPNFVYQSPGGGIRLLLKHYRLSDDVAFRFSDRRWGSHPLRAETYAGWIHQASGNGDVVNLFMDYETFGEHQWPSTGIFDFLEALPGAVLGHSDWSFLTPSEVIERHPAVAELSFPRLVSWADVDRDLTAWQGNQMQRRALEVVYALGREVRSRNNPVILDLWRKLQTSDHFYYMCTKWSADGDVHAYFSPYPSPYDAFINYMNVLADFREHVLGLAGPVKESA